MSKSRTLAILMLKTGKVKEWNAWREENPGEFVDLSEADLAEAKLTKANLIGAHLFEADFRGTDLFEANLYKANLTEANLFTANLGGSLLTEANLFKAVLLMANLVTANLFKVNLIEANLYKANLVNANLSGAKLSGANLVNTNLRKANLVRTNLSEATLADCKVFGLSAWKVNLEGVKSSNLRITPESEPDVKVDDLMVAQFVYLLLHNPDRRPVIDTSGEKGVLILGRFTEERTAVLAAIRIKLRELEFVPMMFEFKNPTQRDFTETIQTLAGLSRFIIADITNPRSSPLELQASMPDYMVPFVPIIQEGEEPLSMFRDIKQKYGEWVLDLLEYDNPTNLANRLEKAVVSPALKKSKELLRKETDQIKRHINDFR